MKRSAKPRRVVIFGAGNIGAEARIQLEREGYTIAGIVTSKKLLALQPGVSLGPRMQDIDLSEPGNAVHVLATVTKFCGDVDVFVSTIPGGDGSFEKALMDAILPHGTPFVSAAKVAFAKHFADLVPFMHKIGRNAMVGGGTMMLDFTRKHLALDDGVDSQVHFVINGTLSYAMTNRWRNRSMDAILRECVALKLAEPIPGGGTPEPLSLFNGEIDDQIWKLLIILNDVYHKKIGRYVTEEEIKKIHLDSKAYQRYTAPGTRRKFVVRISTSDIEPEIEQDAPGSIWANIDGKVFVCGGFYDIPYGSALAQWVPDIGPGNAVHIDQAGNPSLTSGDGAGPLATCMSIMHDVKLLCPR